MTWQHIVTDTVSDGIQDSDIFIAIEGRTFAASSVSDECFDCLRLGVAFRELMTGHVFFFLDKDVCFGEDYYQSPVYKELGEKLIFFIKEEE